MIRFEDTYTLCRLPPQHVVCGLELEPLTLGHAGILESLGLWDATAPSDLILAAYICSVSSKRFSVELRGKWLRRKLRLWTWRLGHKFDYAKSAKCWRDYVVTHTDLPFMQPRGKARSTSMPRLEIIRTFLLAKMGYSPDTIDDARYSRAVHDYNGYLEAEDCAHMVAATRLGVLAALKRN